MKARSATSSIRLMQALACVFCAGLLVASTARAQILQTIGYDPMVRGDYQDLSLLGVHYVPFAFDFGGGLYSLDSVKLFLLGAGGADASFLSLHVTSTLGTDATLPPTLAALSAAGTAPAPTVFTFLADSAPVLTSGLTYYLRMTYAGSGDLHWVSGLSLPGDPPADGGGGPGGPGGPGGGGVTLTPLMTLNPNDGLTFRTIGDESTSSYIDRQDFYGISFTATAVPEPSVVALFLGGGGALAFTLYRRRFHRGRHCHSAGTGGESGRSTDS